MSAILELAKRVKRGAKLLDQKFPGWRRVMRKHEDQFDLGDGSCCILGTLEHHQGRAKVLAAKSGVSKSEDGYTKLTAALNIRHSDDDYGFSNPGSFSHPSVAEINYDKRWKVLEDLWRAEFGEGR